MFLLILSYKNFYQTILGSLEFPRKMTWAISLHLSNCRVKVLGLMRGFSLQKTTKPCSKMLGQQILISVSLLSFPKIKNSKKSSHVWWSTSLISPWEGQRQMDCCEFEASLSIQQVPGQLELYSQTHLRKERKEEGKRKGQRGKEEKKKRKEKKLITQT